MRRPGLLLCYNGTKQPPQRPHSPKHLLSGPLHRKSADPGLTHHPLGKPLQEPCPERPLTGVLGLTPDHSPPSILATLRILDCELADSLKFICNPQYVALSQPFSDTPRGAKKKIFKLSGFTFPAEVGRGDILLCSQRSSCKEVPFLRSMWCHIFLIFVVFFFLLVVSPFKRACRRSALALSSVPKHRSYAVPSGERTCVR